MTESCSVLRQTWYIHCTGVIQYSTVSTLHYCIVVKFQWVHFSLLLIFNNLADNNGAAKIRHKISMHLRMHARMGWHGAFVKRVPIFY